MAGQRNMKFRVQARQEAAKNRAAGSADRTPQQQLALLDKAGLVAVKERIKLHKRMTGETAKAVKVKKTVGDPVKGRGAVVFENLEVVEKKIPGRPVPPPGGIIG